MAGVTEAEDSEIHINSVLLFYAKIACRHVDI